MKIGAGSIKNKTKLTDMFIILLLLLLCFGYLGLLRTWQIYICVAVMMVFIIFMILNRFPLRKLSILWGALYCYIIINALLLNHERGIKYIIIFTVAIMLLMLSKDQTFYKKLIDIFGLFSVIFAIATVINAFYPEIVIKYLGFMIPPSQIETIIFNLEWGGFPGLAGELSYNAFCLSIGFGIFFGKILSGQGGKTKNIAILILLYVGILLTVKRSMILIIPCIAMLIYLIVMVKSRGWKKVIPILILILSPVIYEIFLSETISNILNKGQDTIDLSKRELYWNIAFDMIKDNPIFGSGINSYDIFLNRATGIEGYAGAHNSYLQIISELGVVGATLYFILIFGIAYRTLKALIVATKFNRKTELYLVTASLFIQLVCLFLALTENPLYQQQQLLTYFMFVGIALKIINNQKTSLEDTSMKGGGYNENSSSKFV